MERRRFIATLGGGIVAGAAGCVDVGGDPTGENEVGMTQVSFRPEKLTVEPGTTVTFINTSSHSHTVTAFQGAYPEDAEYWSTGDFEDEDAARKAWEKKGGGKLTPSDEFEHTFEYEGIYKYYCIPHYVPDKGMAMEGQIVVEQGADTSARLSR